MLCGIVGLDPPFAGVFREARSAKPVGMETVEAQDMVFLSVVKANLDVRTLCFHTLPLYGC